MALSQLQLGVTVPVTTSSNSSATVALNRLTFARRSEVQDHLLDNQLCGFTYAALKGYELRFGDTVYTFALDSCSPPKMRLEAYISREGTQETFSYGSLFLPSISLITNTGKTIDTSDSSQDEEYPFSLLREIPLTREITKQDTLLFSEDFHTSEVGGRTRRFSTIDNVVSRGTLIQKRSFPGFGLDVTRLPF